MCKRIDNCSICSEKSKGSYIRLINNSIVSPISSEEVFFVCTNCASDRMKKSIFKYLTALVVLIFFPWLCYRWILVSEFSGGLLIGLFAFFLLPVYLCLVKTSFYKLLQTFSPQKNRENTIREHCGLQDNFKGVELK